MTAIGTRMARTDALDKVTGAAKYTADLCPPGALIARVLHSTVANGLVETIDTSAALAIPGVVAVFTCFDVPERPFATAGNPWVLDKEGRDIEDRLLLNRRVRYVGDDVAVVVAEDQLAADKALAAIRVEYTEYPPMVNIEDALAEGAQPLHPEKFPTNVMADYLYQKGDMEAVRNDSALRHFHRRYTTQSVQQCHLESVVSYAYPEGERITVVTSTQVPFTVQRITAQALGLPTSAIRLVKPYVGGGFGNKQEALYEPLNAWLAQQLSTCVKLELSREEVFTSTRQRHAINIDYDVWITNDGRIQGRDLRLLSRQGAYASHGQTVVSATAAFLRRMYTNEQALSLYAATVYTNTGAAGAMRGYGANQGCWAGECMIDDMALELGMDPMDLRLLNLPKADDPEWEGEARSYGLPNCLAEGRTRFGWDEKRRSLGHDTGNIRRGVGMASFCYDTGAAPGGLETASIRMTLTPDGDIILQPGASEIGQGSDTVLTQMAADAMCVHPGRIHVVSTQDTDVSPFDTGAYASRQTYVAGKAVAEAAEKLQQEIITYTAELRDLPKDSLTYHDGAVWQGETCCFDLSHLGIHTYYDTKLSRRLVGEATCHCTTNAPAFGCCFAEVEVDLALGRLKVTNLLEVLDSGVIINPAQAEGQVHGSVSLALGYAVGEIMRYADNGKLLNANLMDYKMPTALDMPDNIDICFLEHPEPTTVFGNKGLGEPPAVPVAPAIRNAVLHATGVAFDHLPLDPQTLVAAFQERGMI